MEAITVDHKTPIFQCCRSRDCDCCIVGYEDSRNCKLVGFYKPLLYAYTIPDLSKYCHGLDNNTIFAHVYYKDGKLLGGEKMFWQYNLGTANTKLAYAEGKEKTEWRIFD